MGFMFYIKTISSNHKWTEFNVLRHLSQRRTDQLNWSWIIRSIDCVYTHLINCVFRLIIILVGNQFTDIYTTTSITTRNIN